MHDECFAGLAIDIRYQCVMVHQQNQKDIGAIAHQEVFVNIKVSQGNLDDIKTQALILPVFENERELKGHAGVLDHKIHGIITEIMNSGDFKGKSSEVFILYTGEKVPVRRVALAGLGKRNELTLEKIRNAYSKTMQGLRNLNVKDAATSIDLGILPVAKEKIASAVVEGAILGLYQYTPYKTMGRDDIREMRSLEIVTDLKIQPLIKEEIRKAKLITEAVCFARDLISAPSNEMTPTIMAEHAKKIAKKQKVSCTVLDKGKMKALGMNSLLGVASGSHQPPKLIILEYQGSKKGMAPIALIGKGLTFDSGGISIKPAEKMDEMKTDMSGGAAVMAVIMAAADLRLPINLVGLIPATENMPGGNAYKPGDILKSYSGKTIEVINTDAEGRLILADALAYALKYKPRAMIDIATLTGACIVALGDDVIGMLGTDQKMKDDIRKASEVTGEMVWELPLWDQYSELIKSDIADYKNTGGRPAGTITAAAFLSKFVGDCPWVHLDIAGPAWTNKDKPYIPKGAAGVTVRLLIEYLKDSVT